MARSSTATCSSILTDFHRPPLGTLSSAQQTKENPNHHTMLQQRSESATPKDLGEDWPKKPVTNLLLKEATTKKQHSVNISYNMGTGHPKDFLVYFLYSGPSMYRHFGRNTHGHFLEPPALCLCTLVVKHSCHHHMPFCQSPLFASFLALQVPLRNLLYLL